MLRIVVPIILQQMFLSLNFIVDNFVVAKLGDDHIAAIGSSNKFMLIIRLAIIAISAAGATLMAQFTGKGDKEGVRSSFLINVLVNLSLVLVFLIAYFANRNLIARSFSSSMAITELCDQYLVIIIFSSITFAKIMPLMTLLRNAGRVNEALGISVLGVFINAFIDWLLVSGRLGMPQLGIGGIAISTIISEVVTLLLLVLVVKRKLSPLSKLYSAPLSFRKAEQYLRLGLPLFASSMLTSLGLMFSHNIFGKLGGEELAAYGVISPIEGVICDIFVGLGIASVVIIGAELGRNSFEKAYATAKKILAMGLLFSALFSLSFLLMNKGILQNFYSASDEAYQHMTVMFKVMGLFMAAKAFNCMTMNGVLSSGGDNVFIMLSTIITDWLFMLLTIYIGVFFFNWSIFNVYLTMNLSDLLSTIIFFFRFRSKRWLRNVVGQE